MALAVCLVSPSMPSWNGAFSASRRVSSFFGLELVTVRFHVIAAEHARKKSVIETIRDPSVCPRTDDGLPLLFQRENLEMFLKGCESFGLKSQDLFQVNDLYEHKNLYMVSRFFCRYPSPL